MKYYLKIYEPSSFHEIEVTKELFPFKAIKENDDRVIEYLDEHYPNWRRVVVIFEYMSMKQRWLIERKS